VKKDAFSGPRWLLAAAKAAAGVPRGNEFSPWLVEAIQEKLNRDYPGLLDRVRQAMQDGTQPAEAAHMVQESSSPIDDLVAWAIEMERQVQRVRGEEPPETALPSSRKPKGPRPPKGQR
jgi:hypothetical protein